MGRVVTGLLWIAAVGCGCVAGVFFAASTFLMPALARIGVAPGVAAMNSVNTVILGSLFMPLFYGTTLAGLVLAAASFSDRRAPGAPMLLIAGLVYVIGMFGITLFCNVPLNNALASADPGTAQGSAMWARYVKDWTLWNHVRTTASVVATVLYIMALRARA